MRSNTVKSSYVLAAYFCNKVALVYRTSSGSNAADKMMATMNGIATMFKNPFPSLQIRDVLPVNRQEFEARAVLYLILMNIRLFLNVKNNPPFSIIISLSWNPLHAII